MSLKRKAGHSAPGTDDDSDYADSKCFYLDNLRIIAMCIRVPVYSIQGGPITASRLERH
jgi:hypothetical protein